MHPSSLLSYYPDYSILDQAISLKPNTKKLNLFFDLKNNLQSTYMQHTIVNIIETTKKSRIIDTSVFLSLISFLSFHKIYSIKRNIDIDFYIFFESGVSYYHKNISKQYKISRRIDDLYGLDRQDRDLFYDVLSKNYQLIEKVLNKIPKVNVIRLPNFEADFIPYYLITRNKIPQDNCVNIIYSNDHDLRQCINDNTIIYSKTQKEKRIISKNEVMKNELKKECSIPDEYLPLSIAIIGDTGDDIEGISKIGPSRFLEISDELISILGPMNSVYDKICSKTNMFDIKCCPSGNKYLNKVISEENNNSKISNNLKLASFELISREFENPSNTEILAKRDNLNNLLENKTISSLEGIKKGLQLIGVEILTDDLDNLYFNY